MSQHIDYAPVVTTDPKQVVLVPAILLYIAAGFGLITACVPLFMGIVLFVGGAASLSTSALPSPAPAPVVASTTPARSSWTASHGMNVSIYLVGSLLNFALYGFVAYGARRLQQLRSYGMVMTATILVLVPLCPCCFSNCFAIPLVLASLPAGIWTLVVILRPEVKAAFV